MIKVEELYKSFGNLNVLSGISCNIKEGEVVAIIGPSGTGKSTFLRCLNFLEKPDKGKITIDGCQINSENCNKNDIYKIREKSTMIFQNHSLFYNKTVEENIMLPLMISLKKTKKQAKEISENILQQIGLLDKKNSYPSSLSGGQQQRVGIGRAMALERKTMLFDEPTSALDPTLKGEVLDLIRMLAETKNTTMVIVTHEIAFAEKIADQIFYINHGKILEKGTTKQVLSNPQHEEIKTFLNMAYN